MRVDSASACCLAYLWLIALCFGFTVYNLTVNVIVIDLSSYKRGEGVSHDVRMMLSALGTTVSWETLPQMELSIAPPSV